MPFTKYCQIKPKPITSTNSTTHTNQWGTSTTTTSSVNTIPNSSLNTSNSTASVTYRYSNGTLHQTTKIGNTVSSVINRVGTGTSPIYRTTSTGTKTKTIPKYEKDQTPEERVYRYPKPAYSYSCLIALALKNSLTGSLPVSDIYSFMRMHFPYFRTAPKGWKNSVRHNLSSNKCFKKIKELVVSRSNGRKFWLWALNPAKAHKMDEVVLKWSKNDLQGIKDAMLNPEVLENLERGKMNFEVTSSGASSCSEEESNPMSNESSELQIIKTELPSELQQLPVSTQVIYNPVNTSPLSTTVPVLTTTLGLKTSSFTSSTTQTNHWGTSTTTLPVITIPNSSLNSSNTTASVIYSNGTLHQSTMIGNTVSSVINRVGTGTSPIYRTTSTETKAMTIPKYKSDQTPEERVFPKPAYSYSCLIALALKNSLTGSLPVSDIYSFMLMHFPYFRTAPKGWKSSVRHNLSLNKCFEKIEKKPVIQFRNRGCLWALNPAKAHKVDEEVLKWRKIDLWGIKDAMLYPEVLENLERGEIKFEVTSSGASSCCEDKEEERSEPMSMESSELQPIKILNPLNASISIMLPDLTLRLNSLDNIGEIIQSSFSSQSPNRMISENPEFILPHSNIQSNGALVDDFGNEFKIEGELLSPKSFVLE